MGRNSLNSANLSNADDRSSALQEEIRKQGVPYSSEEPDPLYWANFRVRVMEQIEGKQASKSAAVWSKAKEWLAEHVVGASIATSAAAFVVAMFVMMHPFDVRREASNEVAVKQPTVAPQPTVVSPAQQNSIAVVKKEVRSGQPDKMYAAKKHSVAENYADAEALTNTETDDAVSLEELSPSDLQGVLQNIQAGE